MTASRKLYILLSLSIIFAILFFKYENLNELIWAFDLFLLFFIFFDYKISPKNESIRALRLVSKRLSIGQNNQVEIELYNLSPKKIKIQIKDDCPSEINDKPIIFSIELEASSKISLFYDLKPTKRGSYSFGNINIRYLSNFSLFWLEKKIDAKENIKVYSDLKALKELSVKLSHSTELGETKLRKRGQGTDFACLREYISGDDLKSIDWKATARRARPISRVYDIEHEQTLLVLLDAGRLMLSELEGLSRFEHGLNAALSLVLTGLMRNDQVGLGIFADSPLFFMPARRGKSYFKRILEASANIQARMIEPDYLGSLAYFASAQKSRALIVLISDLNDPTGSKILLSGLARLSPRHLPLCVTLKDPELEQLITQNSNSTNEILEKAIAIDLVNQRNLAFSHLIKHGCLVLDSTPKDLSNKLVDKYLEIKARALL